jgi:class 3 adenylate cyclase/uncharacterized protein (DUF427 family)
MQELQQGYRVSIEPCGQQIRVMSGGETVADSAGVLVMHETRLPPVYYFPKDDIAMGLLVRNDHRTNCPFKGNATYWSLKLGDKTIENAAWSYEDPYDEAADLRGYLAFDWPRLDAWFADDENITDHPREAAPARPNEFITWLVEDAWKAQSSKQLVEAFTEALIAAGVPLWRLRLFIRTLNPQLFATLIGWQRDVEGISEFQTTHAAMYEPRFSESPIVYILNGEGGVRRRLEGDDPKLDFPVLKDLHEKGATDYVAMPLRFSDGQINILMMVSDKPGGFSTEHLGQIYEVLPNLSRLLEAYAQRVTSLGLLQTYLGANAGQRVMDGLVKRGDGENLHAVIWFSDLRGSTRLAASLPRDAYLAALNQYFDCVAGAVIEHGGEVLKFIGDAVLAIFPIDDTKEAQPDACKNTLAAVGDAQERMARVNQERSEKGDIPLDFGIALHRGDITYGNVGTERRLDFTVIGPAVNEAARIESLCKTLNSRVLISSKFAQSVEIKMKSLGEHALPGVPDKQEIFTLP